MVKDLDQAEVDKLNAQRTTATTMEPCDLLYIDKLQSMLVVCQGMQDEKFLTRLRFFWNIDLFKGINRNHMLPLITNLDIRYYRKGQYIQREGEEPEGLMIIREGCAIVGKDKISMRRLQRGAKLAPEVDHKEIKMWRHNPKLLKKYQSARVFQNKRFYLDENSRRGGNDMIVY